jgi:putative SOS response-associated peptidase YedK
VSTKKLHESEVDRYLHLLNAPDPNAGLAYHPVSTRVNSATHHGADLIAPIELGAPETLF